MSTKFLLVLAGIGISTGALAQGTHYVAPHVTSNGTYVQGHYQTNPNGTATDNWSTVGNVNPYTGQPGTKNPYAVPAVPTYTAPAPVTNVPELYRLPTYPTR